jgi:hypothetical protein
VFLLVKNEKNISRISKISYNRNPVKQYPLVGLILDPWAVSPDRSDVATTPMDGVSAVLIETQIF